MMGRYLNLDSTPKKLPTQTWWQWFPEGFDDFKERADTILKWHNNILDPKVHRFVHFIATEGVDSEKILSLRQTNEMLGIPQPHILGNYWFLPNNYCETVLGLVEWSESQVKKLESHGMQNLKRVSEISNWEKQSNPPCMISDEEFAKQNAEEDEFRTKTSTSPI